MEELERWAVAVHQLTSNDPNAQNVAADLLCAAHLSAVKADSLTACDRFAQAAARYKAMPCPARQAEALIGLAEAEWKTGNVPASASAGRDALTIAERVGARALAHRAAETVERADLPPVLATVLFTDIVGSTELAAAVGDRAWRALLERHNALVRRELSRWDGQEVDTTGDGFLATFRTPAQGIRCALSIRDALSAAGIAVRAGLHTGECQVTGGEVAGIAVHIAARVSAAARPVRCWCRARSATWWPAPRLPLMTAASTN